MRNLEAWLGVLLFATAGCGGQSHANERGHGGATGSGGALGVSGSAGAASASSGAGNHAGGLTATGGAGSAGVANGGAESAGGSNLTEGGRAETAGAAGEAAGGSPDVTYPNAKPSEGCGKDATQALGELVKYTIQTSGTKDANCADKLNGVPKCGAWSYPRDYYLWLPPDYDKRHAYPLVLQAPGCGGNGTTVYSLSPLNSTLQAGASGSVIRVGLTPPPNDIGHATNPGQGCFDDREGDDSVEWPFYEALLDKLKTELCYDENRVFASGESSGAWLSNELGCKYAGNTAGYALRGVAVTGGGLPTLPAYTPTCTNKPMSGMWIDEVNDPSNPFSAGDKIAINRAMQVNGCASDYDTARDTGQLVDFPIGDGRPSCKKILGCAETDPLVVCQVPGLGHASSLDQYANPGFATYLKSFELP